MGPGSLGLTLATLSSGTRLSCNTQPNETRDPMPLITGFDHFVLTVSSIEETCAFYGEALGVEVITFAGGRKALLCGDQKINLHEAGREFEPKAAKPTPGAGDFCLVTEEDLEVLAARLDRLGIVIEEGPVARTGARGPITSLYLRDPDGNLVEVARYDGQVSGGDT